MYFMQGDCPLEGIPRKESITGRKRFDDLSGSHLKIVPSLNIILNLAMIVLTVEGLAHTSHFCRVEFNSIKCERNATVDSEVPLLSHLKGLSHGILSYFEHRQNYR